MKCPDCGSEMKVTDLIEMKGKPVYKTHICNNLECFKIIETLDGKIIGEEVEVTFWPSKPGG